MSEQTQVVNVTFTVDKAFLAGFDSALKEAHYASRSAGLHEAMRDLIDKLKRRSKR